MPVRFVLSSGGSNDQDLLLGLKERGWQKREETDASAKNVFTPAHAGVGETSRKGTQKVAGAASYTEGITSPSGWLVSGVLQAKLTKSSINNSRSMSHSSECLQFQLVQDPQPYAYTPTPSHPHLQLLMDEPAGFDDLIQCRRPIIVVVASRGIAARRVGGALVTAETYILRGSLCMCTRSD